MDPKDSPEYGTGGPAFPVHETPDSTDHAGMTLRDYFAAHAPSAPSWWIESACRQGVSGALYITAEAHAQWALMYADAMLRERGA